MIYRFDDYWLNRWIDEFEISSVSDCFNKAKSPTVVKRLYELARDEVWLSTEFPVVPSNSVLAGHMLDLSATHTCKCPRCMMKELTRAVCRTSHYFGSVTLSGPDAHEISETLERRPKHGGGIESVLPDLAGIILVLIRAQGIRHLPEKLYFATKPKQFCNSCMQQQAKAAGLEAVENETQSQLIVERLVKEAQINSSRDRTGAWVARIEHAMPAPGWGKRYDTSRRPSRRLIVEDMFHALSAPAVYDIVASNHYKLPLVSTYKAKWLEGPPPSSDPHNIALAMKMPMLEDIDIEMFLEIEQEQPAQYKRFQAAIRAAIDAKLADGLSSDPKKLAAQITRDYVEPELARIEASLVSSQRTFNRKLAAAGVIGSTLTTVGLLGSMPLVLATGVAAAATSLPQLYKFFDDRSGVETSDLYFLWNLDRIRH